MDADKENCYRDRASFTSLLAKDLSGGSAAFNCASCDALRSRATHAEARTGDTLEKLRKAQDEISELRRAHLLAEEASAAAERAKTMLRREVHEECTLVDEEQNIMKRAERRWREEVGTLQIFSDDKQQHRAEAWQQRNAAEEAMAVAHRETEELQRLRSTHQKALEEHLSERLRWQQEVSSMAADFRDLRELAANAARLPATLRMVEEQAAEQWHHLRMCEEDSQRLHAERRSALEAEGELRVVRLQAAQWSQEWCEASHAHELQLRVEKERADSLEAQLVQLELELEVNGRAASSAPRRGSRQARWRRSRASSLTTDALSGVDDCAALSRRNFETKHGFPLRRMSGFRESNMLDTSLGAVSASASSMSGEYEPWAFLSNTR